MKKVKISVIVPIYNVEKYIKKCMDSLIEQSFDDYEIIAVDDGTPDNSMQYVYELQKDYDNIVVVHRENGGLSAARNTGLEYAKGEYVLFCDSDDSLDKDCLKLLYQEAKKENLDMVLFDAKLIEKKEGQWQENVESLYVRKRTDTRVMTGAELFTEMVRLKEYRASACMYLTKRELILQSKLFFYEGIIHEDELFTPRLLISARTAVHRSWLLYERYIRSGSITQKDNKDKKAEGLCIVVRELEKWKNNKDLSKETKQALETIIMQHIRQMLAYIAMMPQITEQQKEQKKEMIQIVHNNHWKLGVLFQLYLIKERIKVSWKRMS